LEQSPRERRPRTRGASARRKQLDVKRVVIFASILLFAVLMILGGQLFRTIFSNEEIAVPDLKGLPLEEAVETLTEMSLQYTTVMRTDAEVEENHIISQDIPPEQMVRKNRSIELTVSQGPRESEVPKLVGQTLTNAEIMLANRFLEAEVSEEFHTLVPLGEVIEQYPPEGSMLPESSIVRIVVSKGPRLTMVKMPDVVGMDIAEARKELDAKQIFISKLDSEESTAYAQGVVLKQSVAKDKEIQEGSSVELTISDGPGPTAKIATVEYLIPNDGEEHTFRIVVEDATGSHEAYHAKLLPGTNVSEVISFQNKAKVLLYLDGVMVYAEDVE
jgi:beta-lactam-binding protein with PASTA domain